MKSSPVTPRAIRTVTMAYRLPFGEDSDIELARRLSLLIDGSRRIRLAADQNERPQPPRVGSEDGM